MCDPRWVTSSRDSPFATVACATSSQVGISVEDPSRGPPLGARSSSCSHGAHGDHAKSLAPHAPFPHPGPSWPEIGAWGFRFGGHEGQMHPDLPLRIELRPPPSWPHVLLSVAHESPSKRGAMHVHARASQQLLHCHGRPAPASHRELPGSSISMLALQLLPGERRVFDAECVCDGREEPRSRGCRARAASDLGTRPWTRQPSQPRSMPITSPIPSPWPNAATQP